jgi:transaldolase
MDRRNSLEQLKSFSTLVADTADLTAIKKFGLHHVTTNPSILKECRGKYHDVVIKRGSEILDLISGTLHVQIDPRFAYKKEETIAQAREWWSQFHKRIMIKIPATLEGIEAMEVLEKEGIPCNMTLVFTMEQGERSRSATCLAPYVGRVSDWHQDPMRGVLFARELQKRCPAKVMGASFRNVQQILSLAGLDFLTIAPKFLEELSQIEYPPQPEEKSESPDPKVIEKLSEGLELFIKDVEKIEGI